MKMLNSFQIKCKEELTKQLIAIGMKAPEFQIRESERKWYADTEIFIETSVKKLNLWIYENGAYIKGPNINIPFEAPDYSVENDLINDFVKKTISLLKS